MTTFFLILLAAITVAACVRHHQMYEEWKESKAEQGRLHHALYRTIPSLRFAVKAAASRTRINAHYAADLALHEAALRDTVDALDLTNPHPEPAKRPTAKGHWRWQAEDGAPEDIDDRPFLSSSPPSCPTPPPST